MLRTLTIAIFIVYVPFTIIAVYSSWLDANTTIRPEPRPFVFVGDPNTPECSIAIPHENYAVMLEIGVEQWAIACQTIVDARSQ